MNQQSRLNFRLLILGQFISLIGERISFAVYISIIATLVVAQNSWSSNLLIIIQFLPLFLFGYIFGSFADVCNRKILLITSEILRIGALIMLLFVQDNLYLIYFSVFILGSGYALFEPARKSLMPFIVPREKLKESNKLYALLEIIALLIGFALSAYLLQLISINTAIIIDIITYIISVLTISLIKYDDTKNLNLDELTKKASNSFTRQMQRIRSGFKYVVKNTDLRYVFVILFIHYLTASMFFAGLNDFIIKNLVDPSNAGAIISYSLFFVAIGAILSYPLLHYFKSFLESTITQFTLLTGTILFIILTVITSFQNLADTYLLKILLICLGVLGGIQYLRFTYILQLLAKKEYLGRVMAFLELIISVTIIIGIGLGLILSTILSYGIVFLICSFLYLIGSIIIINGKKSISW